MRPGLRFELLLWGLALALAMVGVRRWRDAAPPAPAPRSVVSPAAPRLAPVAGARLASEGERVARGNPFRLDRSPAPAAALPPAAPPGVPAPPSAARPRLSISGIVGPPWQALLEGVPGREGAVLVRGGETLGEFRVRSVSGDRVVVLGADTTYSLKVKRAWQ